MLKTLAISGYRSLRNLVVRLDRLNVVSGPNGSGKSSLYRAVRLLAAAGDGTIVAQLAREGGLPSTLWAGPEEIGSAMKSGRHPVQGTVRKDSIHLRLGVSSEDFGYCIDLGLPSDPPDGFALDPIIKRECIWAGPVLRPAALLVDRRGPTFRLTDDSGAWEVHPQPLSPYESMLTEHVDLRGAAEMALVRSRLRSWRFYDQFRSDLDAPARSPRIGTYTPVLSNDGADLPAAIQTIRTIGDRDLLESSIDDAFPGAAVEIRSDAARFELFLRQPGMLRPLAAAELSDGTLRYLLLLAALLSPRPPELLVLNEPETSLHPDLLPALGRLIGRTAELTQMIVVTHSGVLVEHIRRLADTRSLMLDKELGETVIPGQSRLDQPSWAWPNR